MPARYKQKVNQVKAFGKRVYTLYILKLVRISKKVLFETLEPLAEKNKSNFKEEKCAHWILCLLLKK